VQICGLVLRVQLALFFNNVMGILVSVNGSSYKSFANILSSNQIMLSQTVFELHQMGINTIINSLNAHSQLPPATEECQPQQSATDRVPLHLLSFDSVHFVHFPCSSKSEHFVFTFLPFHLQPHPSSLSLFFSLLCSSKVKKREKIKAKKRN